MHKQIWTSCSLLDWLFTSAKEFRLYYLGGQSNMDGYGKVSELPEAIKSGKITRMSTSSMETWDSTGRSRMAEEPGSNKTGHGRNFRSDGSKHTYSDRFGLELTCPESAAISRCAYRPHQILPRRHLD